MGRAWGRGEWPHSDIVSTQHPGLSRRQFAGHLATPECSCHGQPIVLLLNDHCASASRSRPSTTQCPGVSPRCPPPAAVPHSWSDAVGGVLGGVCKGLLLSPPYLTPCQHVAGRPGRTFWLCSVLGARSAVDGDFWGHWSPGCSGNARTLWPASLPRLLEGVRYSPIGIEIFRD